MRIEFMIYFYGAVCVSMLAFNVVYALLLRGSQPRLKKRTQQMTRAVQAQLARLEQGQPVSPRHLARLRRRLLRTKNLTAFDLALRPLVQQDPRVSDYLAQLQPAILYLAVAYRKRENVQAAYFSYFLSRYMLQKHLPVQSLQQVLLEYMEKNNLYCQVNALQALCAFGSPDHIVAALKLQDQGALFLHEKILTETLLSFTGDHSKLIQLLWREMGTFSPHMQLALLNYIRFRSGDYAREMFEVMEDRTQDKEVRLAAIRYFGRYDYPPALEPLLAFAGDDNPEHWEYTTVSVSSLAHYQDERVIRVLKKALHSSNWYVRYAAAASLEAHHMDYEDLLDIVSGNDRYAREMMTYQLESHKMQKAGV